MMENIVNELRELILCKDEEIIKLEEKLKEAENKYCLLSNYLYCRDN